MSAKIGNPLGSTSKSERKLPQSWASSAHPSSHFCLIARAFQASDHLRVGLRVANIAVGELSKLHPHPVVAELSHDEYDLLCGGRALRNIGLSHSQPTLHVALPANGNDHVVENLDFYTNGCRCVHRSFLIATIVIVAIPVIVIIVSVIFAFFATTTMVIIVMLLIA